MKNRQLKDAAQDAWNQGLALLRMGEIIRAQDQFQIAEWLEELLIRRTQPGRAITLRPSV